MELGPRSTKLNLRARNFGTAWVAFQAGQDDETTLSVTSKTSSSRRITLQTGTGAVVIASCFLAWARAPTVLARHGGSNSNSKVLVGVARAYKLQNLTLQVSRLWGFRFWGDDDEGSGGREVPASEPLYTAPRRFRPTLELASLGARGTNVTSRFRIASLWRQVTGQREPRTRQPGPGKRQDWEVAETAEGAWECDRAGARVPGGQ